MVQGASQVRGLNCIIAVSCLATEYLAMVTIAMPIITMQWDHKDST